MKFINNDKTLIVLDLDETLVYTSTTKLEQNEDFKILNYYVYKRPFLTEFIETVSANFLIGVWSSASEAYVKEVVKHIFPSGNKLEFIWGRSKCSYSKNNESEFPASRDSCSEHHYTKPLKKLIKYGFKIERILIIDDSPFKCKQNYGNAIYATEFIGNKNDKELLLLSRYITSLKDIKNVRNIEKRNWRSTVFVV